MCTKEDSWKIQWKLLEKTMWFTYSGSQIVYKDRRITRLSFTKMRVVGFGALKVKEWNERSVPLNGCFAQINNRVIIYGKKLYLVLVLQLNKKQISAFAFS